MGDGFSPAPIKCDNCRTLGRRRVGFLCPDHWFFIESLVEHSKRGVVHVVYACSAACRDALWQRGPGDADAVNERGTQRMRARDNDGVCCPRFTWGDGTHDLDCETNAGDGGGKDPQRDG